MANDEVYSEAREKVLTHSPFVYRGRRERVVDGDTIDCALDLGFGITKNVRLRLQSVDTHEIYGVGSDTDEYQYGREEAAFVEDFLTEATEEYDGDWPLLIGTDRDRTGKYGRFLAAIQRRTDGRLLAAALLDAFPRLADESDS